MTIVLDLESNGKDPYDVTKIWLVVCKDIDTGLLNIFRRVSDDEFERSRLRTFLDTCDVIIGHNYLGYDDIVLSRLVGYDTAVENVLDTFVISKLVDYPRQSHSVEDYGKEFGLEKKKYSDWSKYSPEMEEYCIRDVEITHKIYLKYLKYISNRDHKDSILMEHRFQRLVIDIGRRGFFFNKDKANDLLDKVNKDLKVLDKDILETFTPKLKLIRTVTPKGTKYGTISMSSIPKDMREDISCLTIGAPFSYCRWSEFNPSSHKQIIEVLNEAGWRPVDKTQTHIDTEREVSRLRYRKDENSRLTLKNLQAKLETLKTSGWKVNEQNLETLPPSAPKSASLLAKRILLESRRRTLKEWLDLVQEDNRIHGKFLGIGAWTHRMAHQNPNTANIPNEYDTSGKKKLLGKELRSLWCAPRNRLLVGVDAEGIQLRIFAHYINDPEFTEALVNGKKADKSDAHSVNQRILGSVCRSRAAAKRYIYALLLGAGSGKLTQILDCAEEAAQQAYERLLSRYTGFAHLKETIIPRDAKRGWFIGLDGRRVRIPGDTEGARRHLSMSGYLQNGEAVIMKKATLRFLPQLPESCFLVNFVHDEWQTEVPNDMKIALQVASLQSESLRIVGEELKLNCPLAGSYWNEDINDYTIATNWSKTH